MNVQKELTKLIMESYERGVKDATQAVIESLQEAMRLEREACAKLCEEYNDDRGTGETWGPRFAAMIRARTP